MKIVYRGQLCYASNGEENELVGLLCPKTHHVRIFAEVLDDDLNLHGRFVTVSYFISDKPASIDDLTKDLILHVSGAAESEYEMRYSDYTGYLWTDEDLTIGGHDILMEFRDSIGKYLYMQIEFHGS